MTLAPELAAAMGHPAHQAVAPADTIPFQGGPSLTISLTEGCDAPLEALRGLNEDLSVRCHPCDEAIVRLLVDRVGHEPHHLVVSATVSPGTLRLG